MTNAPKLARWIRGNVPPAYGPLTHLKLQKLAFYCYGAALAFQCDEELGADITFEAWDHGPVNREIWGEYRKFAAEPIPLLPPAEAPSYSDEAQAHLRDVLTVYGVMNAWTLRQESHLEEPWLQARKSLQVKIPRESLVAHFTRKFRGKSVDYPEFLLYASNFALDRVPVIGHPSLRELAQAVARAASW